LRHGALLLVMFACPSKRSEGGRHGALLLVMLPIRRNGVKVDATEPISTIIEKISR
jgi:hypothetical protein